MLDFKYLKNHSIVFEAQGSGTRATCKQFKQNQEHPNVDISHLSTNVPNIKFIEALGSSRRAMCEQFRKHKGNV